MKCDKCRDLFSPYYDGELGESQAAEFIEHLRSCAECKQEFARFTESLKALRSIAPDLEIPGIAESVRKAVSSSRDDQAARRHQNVASDRKVVSEMLRPAKGGLIVSLTAAAAVLVIALTFALLPGQPEPPPVIRVVEVEPPVSTGPEPVYSPLATQEGMVRLNGEWMPKSEALALLLEEKGYSSHNDWFVPREDATSLAMGLFPHEDSWLTTEELARRLAPAENTSDAMAQTDTPEEPGIDGPPETPEDKPEEQVVREPETPVTPEHKTRPAVPRNEVAALLAAIVPEESESHEGLTLVTLTRQQKDWEGKGSFYMTLADAVGRGFAEIKETGTVSKLLVTKKPGIALFSIGGGIVIGGWQNRLTGPDIVFSADTTEAYMNVYCAEQGRWKGEKTFDVADYVAVADLRKKSYNSEEQEYIWKSIKELRRSQGVHTSNSSLHRLYEKRAIKEQIAAFESAFSGLKEKLTNRPHTVGIAALVDGRIVGADLFLNNELLVQHFDHLLRTYAVETAIMKEDDAQTPPEDELRKKTGDFIASAARSSYSSTGDTSYLEYRITDAQTELYGYALTTETMPVHVSLFANGSGLKERKLVARPPEPVEKAQDAPGKQPSSSEKKDPSLSEAAAKLRKEGKIKPRVPLPPSPKPQAPELPRNRLIAPRALGR